MAFDRNVGKADRIIRLLLGALLAAAAAALGHPWWSAGGAVLILTAAFARCPLYPLFGWSTCAPKKN